MVRDQCVQDNCACSKSQCSDSDYLSSLSPSDKPWDVHRGYTDDLTAVLQGVEQFERLAARMNDCSGLLRFGWKDNHETGESRLRLREARFCRVRHCSVCQWRRSLMWQARFYQSLPALVQQYPKARWLFLTLTLRNCSVTDLRSTLQHMNKSWHRLVKRKEFKPVLGWVRTTEITRGKDGSAHPHFHVLLMVPPSMLSGVNYVKQSRWVELWGDCLQVDYQPNIDIRTVKPKKANQSLLNPSDALISDLQGAVAETLKYSTKSTDLLSDPDWCQEYIKQVNRLRFIATGGALKDVLKVDQETEEDMLLADDPADGDDDGKRLAFTWRPTDRHYRRFPKGDK